MIKLSDEQQQALASQPGRALRLIAPATGQAFILLPIADYERLSQAVYDAGPWTDEEMNLLAGEDTDALGWDGMEAYQDNCLKAASAIS